MGLRNAEALTGIRVRRVHFNASGEGKRWETDGHNTDIDSSRAGYELANLRDASLRRQKSKLSYLEVGLTGLPWCYSTLATAMKSL
jgi:hypothetical protein